MRISKKIVAEKIELYLKRQMTLEELVDWAETALMDAEFEEQHIAPLRSVVARLGVADVRAFGLSWEDCQDLLGELGYTARVEVVSR